MLAATRLRTNKFMIEWLTLAQLEQLTDIELTQLHFVFQPSTFQPSTPLTKDYPLM